MTANDVLITEFRLRDKFSASFKGLTDLLRKGLTAVTTATAAVAGVSAAMGAAVVKSAADLEALKMGLTAVAGSTEEAEKQFKRLKEVAKLPGLGLGEAIEGSIALQSAGMSAERAERAIKAFGNALATVGKGRNELQMVLANLTQIMSMGKLTGDELRETAAVVPQFRKAMQGAFGTADTNELAKMGLSVEQILDGIVGQLEKLPQVSGGAKNGFENLSDSFEQLKAAIGTPLLPIVSRALNGIGAAIEKLDASGAFKRIGEGISHLFNGDWLTSTLVKALTWLLSTLDVLPRKIQENWGKMSEAFKNTWEQAKKLISFLVAAFTAVGLVKAFAAIVDVYKAWSVVTKGLAAAQVTLATATGAVVLAGAAIAAGLATYAALNNLGDVPGKIADGMGMGDVAKDIATRQKELENVAEGKTKEGHYILKPGEKGTPSPPTGTSPATVDNRAAQLQEEQTRQLREIASNTRDSLQIERRIMGGGATGGEIFSPVRIGNALSGGKGGRSPVEKAVRDLVNAIEKRALEQASALISGRAAPTERR